MERLKEKNKKNARRLGMSKKRMVGLALGTVGLMGLVYSYVQAGSLNNVSLQRVAKELVDAAAVSVNNTATTVINNTTTTYRPNLSAGAINGTSIIVAVDNGRIFVGPTGAAICNSTVGAAGVIAQYSSGNVTNRLVFTNASAMVYTNTDYYIKNSTCNGPADLIFEIPKGDSSVTLTISTSALSTGSVLDTASALILSVEPEYSAEVTRRLSNQIDYVYDFKKFTENTASDRGRINLSRNNNVNITVQNRANSNVANFIVTLKPTDMAGIANATIYNGAVNSTCDKGADRFICNATYTVGGAQDFDIYVNVTGTDVLSERRFLVDAFLDFAATNVVDKTLLTNANFGEWTYRGTTIYVPLIGVDLTKGRETYIKLQSRETNPNANKVRAIILTSDGSVVTADLGQITPGQPFVIKGSELADKVDKAGKKVGDSFAAVLVVTTDEANLFGYANIIDPSGAKRVPLKVRNGNISE